MKHLYRIILKGYIEVPDCDIAAVKEALPRHIELTRQEQGCLVFEVSQDEEVSNRFNVYEEFIDRHSFSLHQDRVRKSTWGAVSANVERHYQIMEVEY